MSPVSGKGLDEVWERDQHRERGWMRSGNETIVRVGLDEVWE